MPSPTHQLNIEDQIGEVKSATATPAQEVSLKNPGGAKIFTKIEPTATS